MSVADYIEINGQPKIDERGTLNLSNKGLTSLSGLDLIESKQEIRKINLCHNALFKLPPGIFEGFDKVETLDLSGNCLTELPLGVFDGLDSLGYLNLSCNCLNPKLSILQHLFI